MPDAADYLLTEPLMLCGPEPWCVRFVDDNRLDRRPWNVARFDDGIMGSEAAIAHAVLAVHGAAYVRAVERIGLITIDRKAPLGTRMAEIEEIAHTVRWAFEVECEKRVEGYMRSQRRR